MNALWEKLVSQKYEYNSSTEYSAVPRKEIPVRGIWGGLREHTSAHGIPHIDKARGIFKKSMWSVLSLVILGIMIYHLTDVFNKYFDHPVNINLQLQSNRELKFPAVTICNMNPVKQSVVVRNNPELAELLVDSSKKKKRRKKRSLSMSCSSSSQIHTPSGLCFGLGFTWNVRNTAAGFGARSICNDWIEGGMAMPNTLSKFDFIRSSPIFDGLSTNQYWIGITNDEWEDSAPIDLTLFHKFAVGHPDRAKHRDCVTSDRTDGHEWKSVNCQDAYLALCQQMIQCPWPLYNDGSDDICYFLLDKSLTMNHSSAIDLCHNYDHDAQLAVIDTLAKFKHLVGSGILNGATQHEYWMFLKNRKWQESTLYSWSNWAATVTDDTQCGMGHMDQSNEWTSEDCKKSRALALCEWRDTFIPYVPFVPSTTEEPTTTVILESTTQVYTSEITTNQPSTEQSTTLRPKTTDRPTTERPTTDTPTTDTPTTDTPTDKPTTDTSTIDAQTTDAHTTDTPTTDSPTTYTPTFTTPTTKTPTSESPTTDMLTTGRSTNDGQTTLPSSSDLSTLKPPPIGPSTTRASTTVSPTTVLTSNDVLATNTDSTAAPKTVTETSSAIMSTPHDATTTTSATTNSTTTTTRTTSSETPTTSATTSTTTLPPTTPPSPGALPPPPATIPGSQFPERKPVRENFQKGEKAIEILANIPDEQKAAMGYTADEFLLDCQYNGYVCSPSSDFSRFYNGIHGNCYTFNSGWNKSVPLRKSQKTGRRYGLKVVVNIGQDEYTDQFGEEAGARVVLHPQDRMPFPEDEGILATPGSLTTIGVRKVTVKRLPKPFGLCTQYDPNNVDLSKNVFQEVYPVNYSQNSCLKTCYQYYVITECGCADAYYPKEGVAFPKPVVSACDPTNVTQDDCKYDVGRRYMLNKLDCDCPARCSDEFYVPTVSFARWPSDTQEDFVFDSFGWKIPSIFNTDDAKTRFRRNLIKIEVYYEDMNYEAIFEKSAYGDFQFLSDIGGTLGLWLGFSLLTTFEFLEFGVDMLVFVIIRSRSKSTGKSRPATGACAAACDDIHLEALSPRGDKHTTRPKSTRHSEFPMSSPPSYSPTFGGADNPITPVELAD